METEMGLVKTPNVLEHATEAGAVGITTWGDLYKRMEGLRLKGILSVGFMIVMLVAGFYFIRINSIWLTALCLGLAGYYYRNYIGIYSAYCEVCGPRNVVVPNMKGR